MTFQHIPFIQPHREICRLKANKEDCLPSESSDLAKPNRAQLRGETVIEFFSLKCDPFLHFFDVLVMDIYADLVHKKNFKKNIEHFINNFPEFVCDVSIIAFYEHSSGAGASATLWYC